MQGSKVILKKKKYGVHYLLTGCAVRGDVLDIDRILVQGGLWEQVDRVRDPRLRRMISDNRSEVSITTKGFLE